MDPNREFAERVGLCWHELIQSTFYCTCGTKYFGEKEINNHISKNNPDFAADPGKIQLLREMERIGKLEAFIVTLIYTPESNPETIDYDGLIPVEYILNLTGKLRDAAIKFMKEKEET